MHAFKNMFKQKPFHTARSELLEDLLEEAEEANHDPPPPPNGIPRQKLPEWIRRCLKYFVLPFVLLDALTHKLALLIVRPPFKKKGKCLRRGNCCHYILIPYSKNLIGKIFYLWQTEVNGFYLRYKNPQTYEEKKVLVMGCRYLKKDGTCMQYHVRPQICRKWPVIEYFGYPKVLKGCGFYSDPPYPSSSTVESAFDQTVNEDSPLKVLR